MVTWEGEICTRGEEACNNKNPPPQGGDSAFGSVAPRGVEPLFPA